MRSLRRVLYIAVVAIAASFLLPAIPEAQGPAPAQIQAALRAFRAQPQTFTGAVTVSTLISGGNTLVGAVAGKLNAAQLAIASQAVGDLLTANAATTFARLPAVATGQVLASAGVTTAPAYTASPTLTTVILGGLTLSSSSTAGLTFAGTAPTITGAFGTGNSIAGTNSAFVIGVGTTAATSGIVTFAGTWTNIPMCVGTMASNAAASQRTIGIVPTTTTATISFTVTATLTAPVDSSVVNVACFGR